jgi:hypothetical protein
MGLRTDCRVPSRAPRSRWPLTSWLLVCALVVLLGTAGILGARLARAEVEHPRQEWLRSSTAGLFLHWGMFTEPLHLDCAVWERDVTDGGWTADYWIDEAVKLGASYIVLATFHSRLGYARPWPSQIPGSCATQRDFLGELIAAGKAQDVRIILYVTDDPQWHREQGIETLDSAAYSAFKGQQVDLTTRDGFGQFSYDLFFEVMQRYPDLAGFWIDNDNDYWVKNHLYEQIRQIQPTWLLSNNNEDTPIMDTVSNEQKTGMIPPYDYPQAISTPMPRLTEADYKLPTTGEWWFDGGDHPVDVRLSTGRYIANAGSSMKSLMAETAMVDGQFPAPQVAFNDFMAEWVPPIEVSLRGTEGGGYMHGGMQPGFWNDGAHGVITVEPGARTQYVHVVTRPRTDMVRVRDNGYLVTGVADLRTGESMHFSQSGGYLTILDIRTWDAYDTVFQIDTAGQRFFYDQSSLRASASSSLGGQPASNLVDGSFEKFWDSGAQLPVSVTLDLGGRRPAMYLAVHQRESSPTHARDTFGRPEDSARIKDYRVLVSDDGARWREVRAGALRSARGVQFIDIGVQVARLIRLEVLNTWAGPQAPRFVDQLQIDEIEVAFAYPLSFRTSMPLEAESLGNDSSGAVRWGLCPACSGLLQIIGLGGGETSSLTFGDVTVAEAGEYRLEIDRTAGEETSLSVRVNGAAAIEVPVAADRSDVPSATAIAVSLAAGTNSIELFSDAARGPGIDRIAVGPLPPSSYVPTTRMTALPGGLQWVGPGQQSIDVTAALRLDVDDALEQVRLAPAVSGGWSVAGDPATAASMRLGQTLEGSWTVTSPAGQDVGSVMIPIVASFELLGRPIEVTRQLRVAQRPADRVFMREAEDSRNRLGSAGVASCGACSGGQKVRNLGGSPDASVVFEDVVLDAAGDYTLFIDTTVNGTRSLFVTINDGPPIEVSVTDVGNNTPKTTTITVTLRAGVNTIEIHNDTEAAPDLDRLSLG